MIRRVFMPVLLVGLVGIVCGSLAAQKSTTTVTLEDDATGQAVGTATLSSANGGVSIALDLKGLPPGEHALHIQRASQIAIERVTG